MVLVTVNLTERQDKAVRQRMVDKDLRSKADAIKNLVDLYDESTSASTM